MGIHSDFNLVGWIAWLLHRGTGLVATPQPAQNPVLDWLASNIPWLVILCGGVARVEGMSAKVNRHDKQLETLPEDVQELKSDTAVLKNDVKWIREHLEREQRRNR